MPPSASSKRPTRSVFASVNAPFTWPNSSLSNTPSERPPSVHRDERPRRARRDRVEPPRDDLLAGAVLAGDQHVGVRRRDALDQLRAPAASPATRRSARAGRRGAAARFSASSRRLRRSARPSSTCVRSVASRRALSHGFWMKSRAPRRIASTATSTLPHAVITTTGSVASSAWSSREEIEPLPARRRVARVVEVHQDGVEVAALRARGEHARPASRRSRSRSPRP